MSGDRAAEIPNADSLDSNYQILEWPSKVTDKKHIRMPNQKKVIDDDEEWNNYGQWTVLFPEGPVSDKIWEELQILLKNGKAIMLKASTAKMTTGGVICFTKPGFDNAKQAAASIQDIIQIELPLSYKLNRRLESEKNEYGDSIYLCTVKGKYYLKDHLGRWQLDKNEFSEDAESKQKRIQLASKFRRSDFPSKVTSELQISRSMSYSALGGHINILSDWKLRDESKLTQADHMWIAATMLLEKKRSVVKITSQTAACNYEGLLIKIFYSDDLKMGEIIEIADEFIKLSNCSISLRHKAFNYDDTYTRYKNGSYFHGELYEAKFKDDLKYLEYIKPESYDEIIFQSSRIILED